MTAWKSHEGWGLLLILLPLSLLAICVVWPLLSMLSTVGSALLEPSVREKMMAQRWIADAVSFTVWQATLSALLTVALAIPVAYFVARTEFPGRRALLALSIVPFALPSIIVAFSFVIIYGNSGYIGVLFRAIGMDVTLLYNRWAIVFAHVFFNLPFAVRFFVGVFASVPQQHIRSAELLNLPKWRSFLLVDVPRLVRPTLSIGVLTFILCLSSFAIAMVLGGTPELSTTEVAIYQFVRYEFDLPAAAFIAMIQLVLTGIAALVYWLTTLLPMPRTEMSESLIRMPWLEVSGLGRLIGIAILAPYLIFVCLPLLGIALDGLINLHVLADLEGDMAMLVGKALQRSVILAALTGLLSASLAWMLARGVAALAPHHPRVADMVQQSLWLCMGISPTVLALAWFMVLRDADNPQTYAPAGILIVHTVLALPLSARVLIPAVQSFVLETSRTRAILGLPAWRSLWAVEMPALVAPLGLAFALGFALSFGEVGAVALFGAHDMETLPLLVYHLMGSYRFSEAAVLSFLLAAVCGTVFFLGERRSGRAAIR